MRPASAARGARSVREHLAPALYFLQVHLLYATLVGLGAWALTSLRSASVTAKFGIWTAASLNFALPVGGFIDRFGGAPWKGGAFQWVKVPPGNLLQPDATGATVEVTKRLKPSVKPSRNTVTVRVCRP
jgi:hypothetical protein